MNTQQINQVNKIRNSFSENITKLYNSLSVAYRSLSYMRNDWASLSAKVDRIDDKTKVVSETFEKKVQNLQKINPHGLRERAFGISKKREQKIQTYIFDLKLSIAHITDLRQEIKEIIDSIRGPWSDYDDGGVDDDAVTYVGESPSSRDSSSSRDSPSSSSSSSSSPISSPRSSPSSSPRSNPISSLIYRHNYDPRSIPRSGSTLRSSPRISAGRGKKSRKRRRRSKQTKRRQRKINNKSKIKYTIRRR